MCEFCENNKPLISALEQHTDGLFGFVCEINKCGALGISLIMPNRGCGFKTFVRSVDANYCPKCGRELSEV